MSEITLIEAYKAICPCECGLPYLCPACETDDAFVVVGKGTSAPYGHCAICQHTVWLGTYGTNWTHGQGITVAA